MNFLTDIPIGRLTLNHLKNQEHDVVSVSQRLSPKAADRDIVRLAATENRVILCFDLGMAELIALSGESLPSVITFRTTRRHAEYINQRLDEILPEITDDLRRGALVTVEDWRVRIRPLPVGRKS